MRACAYTGAAGDCCSISLTRMKKKKRLFFTEKSISNLKIDLINKGPLKGRLTISNEEDCKSHKIRGLEVIGELVYKKICGFTDALKNIFF